MKWLSRDNHHNILSNLATKTIKEIFLYTRLVYKFLKQDKNFTQSSLYRNRRFCRPVLVHDCFLLRLNYRNLKHYFDSISTSAESFASSRSSARLGNDLIRKKILHRVKVTYIAGPNPQEKLTASRSFQNSSFFCRKTVFSLLQPCCCCKLSTIL